MALFFSYAYHTYYVWYIFMTTFSTEILFVVQLSRKFYIVDLSHIYNLEVPC